LDRGIARVTLKGLETFSDKAFTVDKKGSVCAKKAVGLGVWTQIGLHTKVKMPSTAVPYADKLLVMLFRFPEQWQPEYQRDPVLVLVCTRGDQNQGIEHRRRRDDALPMLHGRVLDCC
jgi:hypothetical protein